MTAATGFKRLGIAIATVVLASVAALGAMAWLIPTDTVREATKAEIRNVTGLDLVLRGDVAVSLFPTGSVSFGNVTLGDDVRNSVVWTENEHIAVEGVNDMVVVRANGHTLVMPTGRADKLKALVQRL